MGTASQDLPLPPATSLSARVRAIGPWVVSLALVSYLGFTQDWQGVAAAFSGARLVAFAGALTAFAIVTLLVDGLFLSLSFRWLAGAGSYWGLVRARGAAYLLTILNAFVGLGGLVVYVKRRWSVPYTRGSGIMMSELVHEVGTLGLLALVGAWLTPALLAPEQIDGCAQFGLGCVVFYLTIFVISRVARLRGRYEHPFYGVFAELSARQFAGIFAIKIAQNVVHGVFVVIALSCFHVSAPPVLAFGLSQIVRIVRGLPVSAFGLGVDQLTFPALFGVFDGGDGRVLAFSIAYTFSMVASRGALGLVFIRSAMAALPTSEPKHA